MTNNAKLNDIKAVLGDLGSSNEARIALLEKRLAVPPSPEQGIVEDILKRDGKNNVSLSRQIVEDSNQEHSAPSYTVTPQNSFYGNSGNSCGVTDDNEEHASKKQKLHQLGQGGTGAIRPSLSPFLNTTDIHNKPQSTTPGSKGKQKNTISRYFPQTNSTEDSRRAFLPSVETLNVETLNLKLACVEKDCETLRNANAELQGLLTQTKEACCTLESKLQEQQNELEQVTQKHQARDICVRNVVQSLVIEVAKQERVMIKRNLQQSAPRIGSISIRRQGINVNEVWEDGFAFKGIKERLNNLFESRENIEAARKAIKRRLPLPGQPLPLENARGIGMSGTGTDLIHPDDWVLQEEVYKTRLAALKREEDGLRSELARLELEKMAFIRDLKRVRDEEGSRFNDFQVLHHRYVLLNLLGRGGFSEVYRAFDLNGLSYVAVKIHQLSSQWSEVKKASYVKHSVREYHIHRELRHPRIVQLLDIFEIDNNTFATVLELCTGGDLEDYSRTHEVLPEKEARAITAQIMSALVYLNTKPRSIIHYDLKPANILFDANGECKITDFGLSKIVEEGHTQGMELTSQGAGTYWYLPPECFDLKATPLISNKVDIWSVGVILYQMLYGKRPFGHDQSQEQLLRNEVMLNAKEVAFPNKPIVSSECKDFIRRCLTYKQEDRLDIHAAAAHQFLNLKKERRNNVSNPNGTSSAN